MKPTLMKSQKYLGTFALFFFLLGCGEGQEYSMKAMQEKFDKAHKDAKQAVDEAITDVNRSVDAQTKKY